MNIYTKPLYKPLIFLQSSSRLHCPPPPHTHTHKRTHENMSVTRNIILLLSFLSTCLFYFSKMRSCVSGRSPCFQTYGWLQGQRKFLNNYPKSYGYHPSGGPTYWIRGFCVVSFICIIVKLFPTFCLTLHNCGLHFHLIFMKRRKVKVNELIQKLINIICHWNSDCFPALLLMSIT